MEQIESGARLAEQLGTVVGDDYIIEDDSPDDERMIVNMGPQHPSTHGVLRLQVELEGDHQADQAGDRLPPHRYGEDG